MENASIIPATDSLQAYREWDSQVDAAEDEGVLARWHFGRALLEERKASGGKQLPHGRLDEVCIAIGKRPTELRSRMQFAEEYDTHEKVTDALLTYGSWHAICSEGLGKRAHVSENTGENEWYTPVEIIEAAVLTMGGIDLDPASTAAANRIVQATRFYTIEEDGLAQPWAGRVWMNPPYAQPLVEHFTSKLVDDYKSDNVTEACVLVNNASDTAWFTRLSLVASARCDVVGRVRFWYPDRVSASPLQGQTIWYFGGNALGFVEAFARIGVSGLWAGRYIS